MARHQAQHYELVVIGAGPAGESAALLAAAFGHRVAVVEREKPGGTVATTGGAPTKTLREAAMYLTGFRHREVYGISVAAPTEVVLPIIAERTRQVCALLQQSIAENFARRQVAYLHGVAQLGPHRTVHVARVGGQTETLSADVVLIATGSRPLHPQHIPFEDPDVCDSEEIFKLGRVPSDLFIVGGGAVGVEFATVFAALGARVTLSDMASRLLPTMDGELSRAMADHFTQIGVRVLLGVGTQAIERIQGKLQVTLTDGNILRPDAVLFAAGRRANTDGLGVEEAGIQLDPRGQILVDADYRTSAEGISAAGDVVGPSLASIAMEQGRVASCRALDIPFQRAVDSLPISAVYGMPEVASAGLTEEQCREQGIEYEVGRCDLATTPRGAIAGHGGLLKLIFRRDNRRLLGVHIFCDIASELVGLGQAAIMNGDAIEVFTTRTFNTPTYTYAYKYAAFDGLKRLAAALGGPEALAAAGIGAV